MPSQQVRETETWMPMKSERTAVTSPHRDALEASGSDFGFTDDEDEDDSVRRKWFPVLHRNAFS